MATAVRPDAAMATTMTNSDGEDQASAGPGRVRRIQPDGVHGEEAGEDAHHEDLGVGEVDEPQDAVDQRVAEGDEGVDGAERQPVDRLGPELVPQTGEAGVDGRLLAGELFGGAQDGELRRP